MDPLLHALSMCPDNTYPVSSSVAAFLTLGMWFSPRIALIDEIIAVGQAQSAQRRRIRSQLKRFPNQIRAINDQNGSHLGSRSHPTFDGTAQAAQDALMHQKARRSYSYTRYSNPETTWASSQIRNVLRWRSDYRTSQPQVSSIRDQVLFKTRFFEFPLNRRPST